MEGRRISAANPRPCSGRRILAAKKRGRSDGFLNSVKKLQRREISSKPDRSFSITNAQERFRNMRLMEEYDTHDPKGPCSVALPFLTKRTKVIEIVSAQDIIFALAHSGVCAAFSRVTNHRICFLNASPDEVILSLFYNKNNDSVITVSVYASDNFSSLKCRSTRIEYIRRGNPDAGFALFESESLKWPGFVEFDDVNGKVLTYSAQDSIYKVFDLKNYTMLYSISDKDVQEIKISPGIMLLILNRSSSYVPLKILSIEDGTILKDFHHLLHRNKKVDFIEQFNEKLLVKQENENLQILDVRHTGIREVSRTEFLTPSAFIFLYENQLFLTFRNRTVAVWNFRGELVTSFEDHLLWRPDCNTNNTYITSDQDLIISYCKAESDDQWMEGNDGTMLYQLKTTNTLLARGTNNHEEFGTLVFLTPECKYFGLCGVHEDNVRGLPMPFDDVSAWTAFVERPISCWTFARLRSFGSCLNCDAVKRTPDWAIIKSHYLIPDSAGSINISNILTGKCLAKINATNGSPKDEECCSSTGSSKQSCSLMKSTVAEALEDITALFYDEDRNEIYTGNRHGLVHVWSN